MESRDVYITEYDLKRLKELVKVGISFAERDRESLEKLQGELDRAHIVEPTAVPGDSRVSLEVLQSTKRVSLA